jgi:hypothetical protein
LVTDLFGALPAYARASVPSITMPSLKHGIGSGTALSKRGSFRQCPDSARPGAAVHTRPTAFWTHTLVAGIRWNQ